jgi:uncharacterized protein (TIGR00369 family)
MDVSRIDPPPGFEPWQAEQYFYGTIGPMFMRYADGHINLGFRVGDKHVNAAQICHGGMLVTLVDIQMGLGANIDLGINGFTVTVNLTTDFLAAARLGQWVQGRNKVVKQTRSLIFSEGMLTVDDEPILRANAVLKVPREFSNFDSTGILPAAWQPKQH